MENEKLAAEKQSLEEQVVEYCVHEITQKVQECCENLKEKKETPIKIKKKSPSSLVKLVKGVVTKDNKCADFMYKKPKRGKRQAKKVDSKSQEKLPENTIVIEIDDFEEEIGPKRIMDEQLQFPMKAKVTKILHDGDKAILCKMFQEFSLSAVWKGDDYGNHIQLRDMFNLPRERDTSSSMLDGYAEIILQEVKKENKAGVMCPA
ncbi:hypothetical protein L1049_015863 [Liquidambar formosana]|uniref:Uncharacterized protein n=1 Tax=Liquidambar formosana TaxID=63359 RepID=A0AAP0RYS0_LIQFO